LRIAEFDCGLLIADRSMNGYFARLLHVDLASGRAEYRPLEESRLRDYVGGIGLGVSLLLEYAPAGIDPLSPSNPLIFASAPLAGTGLTTTAKYAVVTKSPLTGFIADSLSSSYFALELKRLGIDALVVTGRAARPVYLVIRDEHVEVADAAHLTGKSASEAEAAIRAERRGAAVRVAAIGIAGENLVRFATISNEGRHAGRGGIGAVMGSKNLKAIGISGSHDTTVANPRQVDAIAESLRQRSLGSLTDKYRSIGTVANLSVFNHLGVLPTRNFQQATFEHAEALSGETLTENHFSRRHGCAACTIRCERLFKSGQAPSYGSSRVPVPLDTEQRLEYETLFALGPLCGISDPDTVLQAAALCDRYGLDTISTGGTIAWAMEAAGRGLLPRAQEAGLRFGDGESLLGTIRAIGARDGTGELLAEGSRIAAAQIGGNSADWAMHVKGLELPGYDPRSLKTMALGLAVSPRGACHNRSGAYEADFSGEVDRFHGDAGRGPIVAASEDYAAVLDSLIVCKFLRKCFTDFYAEAAEVLRSVTGLDYTPGELRRAGERIHTVKKLFNMRERWKPEDDWLPERLLTDRLGTGGEVGLSRDELREMIRGYYRARGWDEDGHVPESKFRELGINPS
jgi:aldehyde:ferredoxin oxidoreductase